MSRWVLLYVFILVTTSHLTAEPFELTVNGQPRSFVLAEPGGQEPHPTIIMLHGGAGGAEREIELSDLAHLGPQAGFAAVFPQGIGSKWNFFVPGKESDAYLQFFKQYGSLPDDVAFLKLLVVHLIQAGIADPKRVYLAGRSLGGVMALRLACLDTGSFAALGLLITAMPDTIGSHCHPPKPIPVLMINGTDDRVLPYKGLRTARIDILWSAKRLLTFFGRLNGCADLTQESVLPSRGGPKIVTVRPRECPGAHVILYRVVRGGHEVPSTINGTQLVLDFFRNKTR